MAFNLYLAQVMATDVNEATQENRVQIKVEPIMRDALLEHLPWARPMFPAFNGAGVGYGISAVPELNSYVWVYFEDEEYYKRAYYVFDARSPDHTLAETYYNTVENNLNKLDIITAPSSNYPDVVSFHYSNGICVAYNKNSSTPIITTYHPSGSYTIIDKDGNIGAYSIADIDIETAGGIKIKSDNLNLSIEDGNTNKIELKLVSAIPVVCINGESKSLVTYAELNTALQGLVGAINTALGTKKDEVGKAGTLALVLTAAEATKVKTS